MLDVLTRIINRRQSYRRVFLSGDKPNIDQEHVLADLAKFCRADQPTVTVSNGNIDTNAMLLAEGRREVWLRIQAHLRLNDGDIQRLRDRINDD
jgi:pyruvate-formate lyase-activating enzyme